MRNDGKTTRERALDLVAEARAVIRLHPDDLWAHMMADQADMIERLLDYAQGEMQ